MSLRMSGQNIEIVKLQIRRGPEAKLPTLDQGEPAITTDTNKVFIGDGATNHQLAKSEDLATVATSGAYNDLTGKPSLSTVATSGSYTDLTNKPTIPSATVATSGSYTDLINKPNLATVATSGSYNDLLNKPSAYTLPTASATVLGGVKVGTGLAIDGTGLLSATGSGGTATPYNVKSATYNAKGDGSTDDTTAIQNCINACASAGDGYVYFPKGTYMINAVTSLTLPSNIRIVLEPQAVLKVIPNNATTYSVFKINNVSNVFIEGNGATLLGDRSTHTTAPAWAASTAYTVNQQVNANGYIYQCATAGTSGTTSPIGTGNGVTDGTVVWNYVYSGENGMMVNITGSSNIFISNLICKNGWGDGFYVGGSTNCENVFLTNCYADGNRRNGISITNCKTCIVLGGEYKNTSGTDPQFGIDVEPNANCTIQNIVIKGVRTANNLEGGIALIPILMKGGTANFEVTVEDWLSEGDGLPASKTYGIGLLLDNNSATNSPVNGKIKISKASINSPDGMGVYIQGWNNAPRVAMADVLVYNSNTYTIAYAPDQAGFGMDYNSNDPTGVNYGNITFERCGTIDTRGTKVTKYAFAFVTVAGRPFNNITIIDPVYDGVTSTWLSWGVPDTSSGMVAKFNTPTTVNVSSSQALTNYVGQVVNATAAITLTLPSANVVQGAEYTVLYGAASGTVTLALQSGDSIINKGASVTSVALTLAGTFIKVRSIGGNKWIVVEQNIS